MKKFVLKRERPEQRESSYKIDYRSLLNNRQLEAVMHDQGPALIIAGAGTGKTRTLVYRVARLVEDGIPPESILLLTFTRRSARQMLDRASALLDDRCQSIAGGTFHHYCNQILHKYAKRIGFPNNFTLLDQTDATDAIHHIRSPFMKLLKQKRFPQKQTLQSIFSTAKNKQISIQDAILQSFPQFSVHSEIISEIERRYSSYKSENGVMDFDDLLIMTRKLMLENDDIRKAVAGKNRHVMIDEYQDTNNLQAELAALFSSVHNNLMAVGDDAQSIYAFRGANFKNILSFPEMFSGCHVIKLEENYRSTQPILDLANTLIYKAKERFEKNLFTHNQEGDLPGLVKAPNERDQSRFVAQLLLQLREQGIPLNEIAVLFRNGRDSYDLEWELNRNNIPFQKFGGQKFAEAAHVRDVLSHIKVAINPNDQIAWNRILMLLDGIGPKTASDLVQWLVLNKNKALTDSDIVSQRYKKQLDHLSIVLAGLRNNKTNPAKAVSDLVGYYTPICTRKFDDHPKRIKDLESFAGLASGFASLEQLLQELTLDPLDASAMETLVSSEEEAPMVLSTIHSAKGLEWDTVFIIQCLDGIIPSGYSVDSNDQLDEELRLLYVACTRARERLFISYPVTKDSSYGDYFSNPSRFIDGIPETILEIWMLENEATQKQLPPK